MNYSKVHIQCITVLQRAERERERERERGGSGKTDNYVSVLSVLYVKFCHL